MAMGRPKVGLLGRILFGHSYSVVSTEVHSGSAIDGIRAFSDLSEVPRRGSSIVQSLVETLQQYHRAVFALGGTKIMSRWQSLCGRRHPDTMGSTSEIYRD